MWPLIVPPVYLLCRCLRLFPRALSLSTVQVMPKGRKRKEAPAALEGGSGSTSEEAPPPVKKIKTTEATDGGAVSKGKGKADGGKADGGKENKTNWDGIKWNELGQTKDWRPWTKKFSSWNVNGIRAWIKNGGLEYIAREDPDIFCVQETKCIEKDLPMNQLGIPGYHVYWHSAEKKGYSGVGLYSKEKPISVTNGLGIEKFDCEGRIITAEYEHFYFLTSYVPNAGDGLKRLSYKLDWDRDLREYMKKLDLKKPVILSGDLNVAHKEIDLKNPKTNTKTAGFTPEERQDFTELLEEGFVDTFRHLYPDLTGAYTYWSYRFNARAKNTGWRLDYFVVSERLLPHVTDVVIRKEVFGSDHCPLVIGLTDHAHLPHPQENDEP
ncbi:exodeoxyribonuclease-like isoform X2 [Halichondria panicea]|uniref:exodeoxyribonuclease-like isoform X2 n=1 Tax=Halichondria panicea TaxID=6063 RepID=UPI00312B9A18